MLRKASAQHQRSSTRTLCSISPSRPRIAAAASRAVPPPTQPAPALPPRQCSSAAHSHRGIPIAAIRTRIATALASSSAPRGDDAAPQGRPEGRGRLLRQARRPRRPRAQQQACDERQGHRGDRRGARPRARPLLALLRHSRGASSRAARRRRSFVPPPHRCAWLPAPSCRQRPPGARHRGIAAPASRAPTRRAARTSPAGLRRGHHPPAAAVRPGGAAAGAADHGRDRVPGREQAAQHPGGDRVVQGQGDRGHAREGGALRCTR
jgi:hypothetical protein